MINIDGIYETNSFQWVRWETDADGNRFLTYVCYWNRMLAKAYNMWNDNDDWTILYVEKNWRMKKYTLYWYFNSSALTWFILWVLYNGERESDITWDVSNLPV